MQPIYANIIKATKKWRRKQVAWRRHFHQHPELSFAEYKTTAYIRQTVSELGLKILPLKMETGLLAELRGKRPGRTVALRSDIDALPVTERTGLSFRSKVDSCMHACGHDMHMASVLGAAAVLSDMRDDLPGTVRFIFQPAEEMPPGGAAPMIENGAVDGVSMIFGLHVDPTEPTGKIGLRDGVTMAAVTDFDLIVHGRGGHGARPQETVDAIVVASEIVQSLQTIVSREIDPIAPVAVTIGRIEGGVARNVITDRVTLNGTARALSEQTARELPKLVKRIAQSIARAHGAKVEVNIIPGYPVFKNHPDANKILAGSFSALFGKGKVVTTPPVLGGEDFARYLQRVPGAMFRLGCRNRKIGADQPWHSPHFVADEEALTFGTALLCAAVMDTLAGYGK